MSEIKVTNYGKGIFAMKATDYLIGKRLFFDPTLMEITINDCVNYSVFYTIPKLRNISANKSWFQADIFHIH
jgi:hypothetical protein